MLESILKEASDKKENLTNIEEQNNSQKRGKLKFKSNDLRSKTVDKNILEECTKHQEPQCFTLQRPFLE